MTLAWPASGDVQLLDAVHEKSDPLRVPDWRAWRAKQIVEHNDADSYDDAHVMQLVAYYRDRVKLWRGTAPGSYARRRAQRQMCRARPDVHHAVGIAEGADRVRFLLEAALMDKHSTLGDVAKALGVNSGIVETYALLFYDVADRLDSQLYVRGKLLSTLLTRGVAAGDSDQLWKAFGWVFGVRQLLAFVDIGTMDAPTMAQFESTLTACTLRKAISGISATNPSAHTSSDMLVSYTSLRGKPKEDQDDDSKVTDVLWESVEQTVRSVIDVNNPVNSERRELFPTSRPLALASGGDD